MEEQVFKDKVVVITGASGGIGRATAWEFAKQGAKIALLARGEEQLAATLEEVKNHGGTAIAITCDVSDPDQVEAAADQAERELGPIDVWVNNAMASVFAPFKEITNAEFKKVTEVTYLGSVYGTKSAMKRMQPRNKGSIVFVGSALAYRGIPLQSAYCGAKHAMQGFYDSFRTELMHDNSQIKTCMVQLPGINSTQFGWVLNKLPNQPKPMGKVYQPEVAARAVVFAAQHNRREIFVGYPTLQAIIGNKIAPWLGDFVLSKTGYKGQQTDKPVKADSQNNIWEPVHEDRGAHGNFDDIAVDKSFTLWASMNRGILGAALGLAALVCLAAAKNK